MAKFLAALFALVIFSGCRNFDNEETTVVNSTTVVHGHCRNDDHSTGRCCGHHDQNNGHGRDEWRCNHKEKHKEKERCRRAN